MVIWTGTPKTYLPGALGVALPLEGTHAWVFYDRVWGSVPDSRVPALLAHVMVHEIAHLLQGTIRHSESGILKAHWSDTEIGHMAFLPLAFTPIDAILIRHGIEERRLREAQNSFMPAPMSPPTAISGYVAPSRGVSDSLPAKGLGMWRLAPYRADGMPASRISFTTPSLARCFRQMMSKRPD
jgi:hypothetical protein